MTRSEKRELKIAGFYTITLLLFALSMFASCSTIEDHGALDRSENRVDSR